MREFYQSFILTIVLIVSFDAAFAHDYTCTTDSECYQECLINSDNPETCE